MANRLSASCGVSTEVGSSRISSFGSCSRQRAISIRWRSPAERLHTGRSGSSRMPYRSPIPAMRCDRLASDTERGSTSAMFSATVRFSNSEKCWNTMPMPSARAASGLGRLTVLASISISPALGWISPYRILTRVDLPAPFSPSSACTSPRRRSRSIRSLAVNAPKRLVMPRRLANGASKGVGEDMSGMANHSCKAAASRRPLLRATGWRHPSSPAPRARHAPWPHRRAATSRAPVSPHPRTRRP